MITKYTKDHEWLAVDGDIITIGITDYAQEQLGDIVYIELPEHGRKLETEEDAVVIESVKAASEVKSPISGTVVETNDELVNTPTLVNQDPDNDGWLFKLKVEDSSVIDGFMNKDAYMVYVEAESED